MSFNFVGKRVLVVVAHPDDEVLGLGGTIHRLVHAESCEARVVILGDGETSRSAPLDRAYWASAIARRREQALEAMQQVGYTSHAFYDFPDNRFDTVALLDLVKAVEDEKAAFQPDVVFTHHQGDLNVDHQRACEAVLAAFRPLPRSKPVTLLAFETPSSTEWQAPTAATAFLPTVFMQLNEADLKAKLAGAAAYSDEIRSFPHPRSPEALRLLAQRWGVVSGFGLAEAFALLRALQPHA